ncbi:MAG: ATP-dependent zinc metalloprotease FtsH [Oscillospiraceae bacterium]|nr:ATP-dependent zinc metalloprotease FtsH [Oscillospiraceae bacterium]
MNDKFKRLIFVFLAVLISIFIIIFIVYIMAKPTEQEISYSDFLNKVLAHEVKSVKITSNRIEIMPVNNGIIKYKYITGIMDDPNLVNVLRNNDVDFSAQIVEQDSVFSAFLFWSLLMVLIAVLWFFLFRNVIEKSGGGVMSFGKNASKIFGEKKTGITFKDVAGQEEAKESLVEIVNYLHDPAAYIAIGARLPKGALLVGPPGTGKTLLAKAVAGEANVPFFSISGSDFIEMFVGVGASRVRDLFKKADEKAPCIVFIDEIDAVGKTRGGSLGGNDERDQTLNQLLSEMDGFDSSKGVVILAATNRPETLDPALMRPGRFDRQIIVERPDYAGRLSVLKVHIKNVKVGSDINLEFIARATPGAVGADLANIVNESALRAVRMGRNYIIHEDLEESMEVIIAGKQKKDRILSPYEKKLVAYHEVGHALVAALLKDAAPVHKITIVPRTMGSLGYTLQVDEDEKYLMSKDDILNKIKIFMGGRCSEEAVFNTLTTGATSDIEQATNLARNMVTMYGMSDEFGMVALESMQNKYLDGRTIMNCSEETATKVDDEVKSIINGCYNSSIRLIKDNVKTMDEVAEFLMQKETITGEEFMEIFNKNKELLYDENKNIELLK